MPRPKNKKSTSKLTLNELQTAMDNCFKREMKYPTIKFGHFKKMVEAVPSEFDDTEVSFAFILNTIENNNFTLGIIPIKIMAIHPDQTKVLLCDDSAAEEFFKTDAKRTYASDKGLEDGPSTSN